MLYALGSNGSGQLGTGDTQDAFSPKRCLLPAELSTNSIISISAGGNHTLINTPGQLFAAGDASGNRYPLVHIYTQSKDTHAFRLARMSTQFSAATWESSTFVDDIQRLFSCGAGRKGELGLGKEVIEALEPMVLRDFPPDDELVVDLAAGMGHVVILLMNGDAYAWGNGREGQLGQPVVDCWAPRKIEGLEFEPYRVVCGKNFTFLLGSPKTGKFAVLGNDKWGVVSSAPTTLPPWKDVGASWGSCFVLLENGQLLSWGRNDHGQLGLSGLPKLTQIAVGSEHVVALTEDGKVIAWGWGEHGNCGLPVNEKGDVKGRWNEIEVAGKVVLLGAGCATTFIAMEES